MGLLVMIDSFRGKYRFLSNFWPSPIFVFGSEYPTVEHAYQGLKTVVMEEREEIRLAKTPGQAKRLGKKVTMREDWNDEFKLFHMHLFNQMKFHGHEDLGEKLLATGDQELVEGNAWGDTFWGVCNGVGENHLGKILMKIRGELSEIPPL